MAEWTYFAGGKASRADTLRLIEQFHVLWRSVRNSAGRLIPNVGRLCPGDTVHFVFRKSGRAHYVFYATIGKPMATVAGTTAIDRVAGSVADELADAGYLRLADGGMEVVHLEGIRYVESEPLVKPAANQNAIRPGSPTLLDSDGSFANHGKSQPRYRTATGGWKKSLDVPATDLVAAAPTKRAAARFDRYLAVDWSARSSPARGSDSIWIAEGWWNQAHVWQEENAVNCPTRHEALSYLLTRLSIPGRTLVGFDFAFGYPREFADHLPGGGEPWLRTGAYLDRFIEDGPGNKNNRHRLASTINELVGAPPGPFWGCHESAATACLTPRRVGIFQFPHVGLDEFRVTERRVRQHGGNILSVWKIDQGVSVGGQTLMGIPYLMRLRAALRTRERPAAIWPFETGWTAAPDGVTLVEIFPTLVADHAPTAEIKDRNQVRQCVARFASLDSDGRLTAKFERPEGLLDEDEAAVRTEEGWIFLV